VLPVLLEREESLAVLTRAFDGAGHTGQLVAVSGEAGIGKSSLLQAFAGRVASKARVLWGYCEALGTPRPLGPLLDMAPALGGRTADALAAGAPRHDVFAAFITDLMEPGAPIVAFFEDVHWADEATLDLLHYLGRRINHTRAVVVVSWRDHEVGADHSIHRVFGDWPHASVHRIPLRPLSLAAIEQLAAGTRDARAVHALTGGNPFFVTEVLTGTEDVVPVSVREAVLARRARLDAPARAVLDLVSVVPLRAELGVIVAALDPAIADVEACVTAGLLCCEPQAVSFRHELARLAVADALPSPRVQDCHRRVLAALIARSDREHLLARIVHHAEACGDVDALLEYAPAAARQAAALGAHRQAVDHYRRALQHAGGLSHEARAQLTEALAYEHYLTSDIEAARDAQREALALWRRLDVPLAIGRNVRWLSRLAWSAGDHEEAERCADDAIAVLSQLEEGTELAMAYSNRSQLAMLSHRVAPCIAWGTKAIELARRLDARDVLSHALNNVGAVRLIAGEPGGHALLAESLDLALAGDLHEHAARAYANFASAAVERRDYDQARGWLDRGIHYCADRDLDSCKLYMLAWRARLRAETGLWPNACEDAQTVLSTPRVAPVTLIPALAAIGLVRVRRGDPGAVRVLDDALVLARRTCEAQRLVPVLLARAELAWFNGRPADVEDAAVEGLKALGPDKRAFDHEQLLYWLWKVDGLRVRDGNVNPPTAASVDAIARVNADADAAAAAGAGAQSERPYARLMRGEWRAVAGEWERLGCPYERGQALMEGDLKAVQDALDIFHTLGAAPAADWARQRLRQLGLARVPRGRRPSTRAHPAGLTTREAEILAMLALGLRNPQIADRLFVSPKTVEHHVSSILAKLDVPTRGDAVIHAREQGWLMDRRRDRALQEQGK
jgi:DNA-binding CsgD family transcriptional regulator/tetratricopeptide (TPR) repeat protein